MKITILILALMLGVVGRVDAGYFSAGDLLSDCESTGAEQFSCVSYLAAVSDYHNHVMETVGIVELFCSPKKVTLGQLEKIYVKFANDHPEKLHWNASSLTIKAFGEAFPCE